MDTDAQSACLQPVGHENKAEFFPAKPFAISINSLKFLWLAEQSRLGQRLVILSPIWHSCRAYAERRTRPLARRRQITARPAFVFIRARNPWVRLRLILLGWKVRLLITIILEKKLFAGHRQCLQAKGAHVPFLLFQNSGTMSAPLY